MKHTRTIVKALLAVVILIALFLLVHLGRYHYEPPRGDSVVRFRHDRLTGRVEIMLLLVSETPKWRVWALEEQQAAPLAGYTVLEPEVTDAATSGFWEADAVLVDPWEEAARLEKNAKRWR